MKKIISFLIVLFAVVKISVAQNSYADQVNAYVMKWKDVAIAEMKRSGIPASISLAQGIIESGAGGSPLAVDANNHFGIKCHDDWNGATYYFDDDKPEECFRKYKDASQSWDDHTDFLMTRSRYASCFTHKPDDYKGWAYALKAAGYATNPQYPQLLIKAIEDYNLHQYDLSQSDWEQWQKDHPKNMEDTTAVTHVVNQTTGDPQIDLNADTASIILNNSNYGNNRISEFNDVKYVTLLEGETLESVSKLLGLRESWLLKWNDMDSTVVLRTGDRIYIQPKRKNGSENFHVVKKGESMWGISQQFGIQLSELLAKNMMQPGTQAAIGENLYLKDYRSFKPKLVTQPTTIYSNNPSLVNPQTSSDKKTYIVKQGDTMYAISKQFGLTVSELQSLSGLTNYNINIGQVLVVGK